MSCAPDSTRSAALLLGTALCIGLFAATTIWQAALMKDPQHQILRETLQRLGVETLQSPPQAHSTPPP